jgi:hypothetical protein
VHEQTPLMEYDFAVRNLATDFRDGVRLTRLCERLTCALRRHISRLRVLWSGLRNHGFVFGFVARGSELVLL